MLICWISPFPHPVIYITPTIFRLVFLFLLWFISLNLIHLNCFYTVIVSIEITWFLKDFVSYFVSFRSFRQNPFDFIQITNVSLPFSYWLHFLSPVTIYYNFHNIYLLHLYNLLVLWAFKLFFHQNVELWWRNKFISTKRKRAYIEQSYVQCSFMLLKLEPISLEPKIHCEPKWRLYDK